MIIPVELPEELLKQLEASAKSRGVSFREFMVETLRSAAATETPAPTSAFAQRVHDFGAHLESPWTVLSELETESHTSGYAK